jgi:hypothetical protein
MVDWPALADGCNRVHPIAVIVACRAAAIFARGAAE